MNRSRSVAAALGLLLLLIAAGCGAPTPTPAPVAAAGTPAPVVVPVVLDPAVPGWSPVRSVKRAAVYDVPPTWFVHPDPTIVGYETDAGQRVAASGAAVFGAGACGNEQATLAVSVLKHDTGSDLNQAAAGSAREWADLAFRDDRDRPPKLTVDPPEPITTGSGRPAVVVRVTARTASKAGSCKITEGAVYAVAATGFTGELGPTVILVVVTMQGRPDSVPDAEVRRILSTLRPA